MKKVTVALSTLLAVVICAVAMICFAACGANGTYKFYSMSVKTGDEEKVYKVGDEFEVPVSGDKVKLDADYFVITLNKDGSVEIKNKESGDSAVTGTWEKNKDTGKIDFKGAGVPVSSAELKGSKLVFSTSIPLINVTFTYTLKK